MSSKLMKATLAALMLGATGLAAADNGGRHGNGGWNHAPAPVHADRGQPGHWAPHGRHFDHRHGGWRPHRSWHHGRHWDHPHHRGYGDPHHRYYRGHGHRPHHGYYAPPPVPYAGYGNDFTIIFRGRLD